MNTIMASTSYNARHFQWKNSTIGNPSFQIEIKIFVFIQQNHPIFKILCRNQYIVIIELRSFSSSHSQESQETTKLIFRDRIIHQQLKIDAGSVMNIERSKLKKKRNNEPK